MLATISSGHALPVPSLRSAQVNLETLSVAVGQPGSAHSDIKFEARCYADSWAKPGGRTSCRKRAGEESTRRETWSTLPKEPPPKPLDLVRPPRQRSHVDADVSVWQRPALNSRA